MTLAILSRQTPFMQVMLVTLAALFVVMALEGLRSSLSAIWRAHRTPKPAAAPVLEPPVKLAAPAPAAPRSHSFDLKPRAARPKALDRAPRRFHSPRPTIRRQEAFAAATTPAESVP